MNRLLTAIGLLCVAGCSSPSTTAFRLQQTSENIVFAGYVGWTNYMALNPVSISLSNDVKVARLKFAATDAFLDSLRASYATNSAVKPQLDATLSTLADQSSNLVWLINFIKGAK